MEKAYIDDKSVEFEFKGKLFETNEKSLYGCVDFETKKVHYEAYWRTTMIVSTTNLHEAIDKYNNHL